MSMHKHTEPEGTLLPKKDSDGRMYREVRCDNCRAWICDEYIYKGRVRFKCPRCGRITIMEFRPHRSKRSGAPENINLKEAQDNG